MSTSNWTNTQMIPPPVSRSVWVKDSLAGPQYLARWDGPGYGWTVVSYDSKIAPTGKPAFWLNHSN
jgi:hypothetical protein